MKPNKLISTKIAVFKPFGAVFEPFKAVSEPFGVKPSIPEPKKDPVLLDPIVMISVIPFRRSNLCSGEPKIELLELKSIKVSCITKKLTVSDLIVVHVTLNRILSIQTMISLLNESCSNFRRVPIVVRKDDVM